MDIEQANFCDDKYNKVMTASKHQQQQQQGKSSKAREEVLINVPPHLIPNDDNAFTDTNGKPSKNFKLYGLAGWILPILIILAIITFVSRYQFATVHHINHPVHQQLETHITEVKTLITENKELKKEIKAYLTQVSHPKKDQVKPVIHQELKDEIATEIQELKDEIKTLTTENSELKNEVKTLTTENQELKDELTTENQELKDELKAVNTQNQELKDQLKTITTKKHNRYSKLRNTLESQHFFVTIKEWDARICLGQPCLNDGFHTNSTQLWRSFEFSCPITESTNWINLGQVFLFCSTTPAEGLTVMSYFQNQQFTYYPIGDWILSPEMKKEMAEKWGWIFQRSIYVKIEKQFQN